MPFHCQSCPAAVYFYILNISYLYVHSLKCSGTRSLNGFLGLKDYFIICLSGSSSFMTLAELNVLQTLLAHHHSLGVREQHPHCTSSALVFLQSQTSAVLCCIASHCMTWPVAHCISQHWLLLCCCSTCADKNAQLLMASRAWAWLRANAAPLGVGTPVVGVLASYAWNATETHRMAHKIRRGYFQPKAPADYDHRFCLFDRYMMEKASMVGLVGLKSTGKSSTLSHFLREKPNPF